MKKLIMYRGLPACGKSTDAKLKMADNPGAYVRVNKDTLRECFHFGHWTQHNEKFILKMRDQIIVAALQDGKHVISDDTNFGKHEERLRQLARETGAEFEFIDLTSVSLDVCLERDRKRQNFVGSGVIMDMYDKFLAPQIELLPHNESLPKAIIVDIDGTIAKMNGRGPYEFDKLASDLPRREVWEVAMGIAERAQAQIIRVSGRDEDNRQVTEDWHEQHYCYPCPLHMRAAGDKRRDSIIKRELFETHIAGKYDVIAIFDDRPRVIRETWYALGLGDRVFNVGDGRDF